MESSQLTNFYRGDSLIQSASLRSVPPSTESHNFLTFLNLVQEGNFDILPTSWNEGIDYIGTGYTSVISSDVLNLQTSIAFKRIRTDQCNQDREYFSLIAEIRALSHPDIKRHPGILGLEGICLEVRPEDETVRPVLVFEKAKYGNLYEFMNSLKGRESSVRERLAICLDIARALTFMHSCRKRIPVQTRQAITVTQTWQVSYMAILSLRTSWSPRTAMELFKSRLQISAILLAHFGMTIYLFFRGRCHGTLQKFTNIAVSSLSTKQLKPMFSRSECSVSGLFSAIAIILLVTAANTSGSAISNTRTF